MSPSTAINVIENILCLNKIYMDGMKYKHIRCMIQRKGWCDSISIKFMVTFFK
jgi:hypothetical protein